METKLVSSPQEISLCRQLAYRILVVEGNWTFPENNKSGLKVVRNGTDYELVDDYEEIAEWAALFVDDEIVGCNRRCGKIRGQFELERYIEIPEFLKTGNKSFEHTRLCINPVHRSRKAIYQIAKFWYKHYVAEKSDYLFTTAHYPVPGKLYTSQLGLTKEAMEFKYNPCEPRNCHIFYVDVQDSFHTSSMIEKLENITRQDAIGGVVRCGN